MSEVNDVHMELPYEFKGKKLIVTRRKMETEGFFGEFLRNRARKFAETYRGTPDHMVMMQAIAREAAAGQYNWGSETCAEAMQTNTGFEEMAFLIFQQYPDNNDLKKNPGGPMTRQDVHEMFQDSEKFAEFLEKYLRANAEATPPTPPAQGG
jgi:hypothetical protein